MLFSVELDRASGHELGLVASMRLRVKDLSGGQRQAIAIARAVSGAVRGCPCPAQPSRVPLPRPD
jgi:ABC-type uncharacterized transport system ATPase component